MSNKSIKFNGRIENAKWELCPDKDVHYVYDFLMEEERSGYPVADARMLRFIEVYKEFREFFFAIGGAGVNIPIRPRRILVAEAEIYANALSDMVKCDQFREEAESLGYIFKDGCDND